MVYVILTTLFLKTGMILTGSTATQASSELECNMFETPVAKDAITNHYKTSDIGIVWVDVRCIKIEKKAI